MAGKRSARIILRATDRATKTIFRVRREIKMLGVVAGAVGAVQLGRILTRQMKEAVSVAADFEQGLSRVAAVAGKTKKQIVPLAAQAKELGRTTEFTARQVVDAQNNLTKAGFALQETFEAVPGLLSLASAGEIGLAESADLAAQAIRSFALEAGDASDIADLYAKAANTSNMTVTELGEAMKYAAPAAKALGVDITETTAAIALLHDRGLKGSLAGTALAKTMTTIMGSVNKLEGATGLQGLEKRLYDTNGQFIGLEATFDLLREAGVEAGDMFAIFGERAGKAGAVFADLDGEIEGKTLKLLDRLGFALKVQRVKLDNLKGDVTKLKSAFEGLQLSTGGPLQDSLRIFIQQITAIITGLTSAQDSSDEFAESMENIGEFITKIVERTAGVIDFFHIVIAGIRMGVAQVQGYITDMLVEIAYKFADFMAVMNVRGVFDEAITATEAFAKDMGYVAEGFHEEASAIMADAITFSTAIDKVQNDARAAAEKYKATKAEREKEREEVAKTQEETPAEEAGPPLPPGFITPEKQAELEAQQLDARRQWLQAHIDAEKEYSLELFMWKEEMLRLEHEKQLAEVEGNNEAKRLLEEAHEMEMLALLTNFNEAWIKAQKTKTDAETKLEVDAAKKKKQTQMQIAKAGVQLAGEVFGNNKGVAIANAIINTKEGVTKALTLNPPYSYIMAAITAAKGLAEVNSIRKQKIEGTRAFQYGGMISGPGGVDNVNLWGSHGELVADTTEQEARAILSGQAMIVPAGAGGGDVYQISIAAMDGESVKKTLFDNPDATVEAFRRAKRLGLLDDGV